MTNMRTNNVERGPTKGVKRQGTKIRFGTSTRREIVPMAPKFERLRQLPLLAGLNDDEVHAIAEHFERLDFPEGTCVMEKGAEITDESMFYLIDEGSVDIIDEDANTTLTQHSGWYFGEDGLLEDKPRSVKIKAATDLVCLCITKANFQLLGNQERIRNAFACQSKVNQTHKTRPGESVVMKRNSTTGEVFVGVNDLQMENVKVKKPKEASSSDSTQALRKNNNEPHVQLQVIKVPAGFLLEASNERCLLDVGILIVIAYSAIATPYRAAFHGTGETDGTTSKLALDSANTSIMPEIVRSMLFFGDLISRFVTSYTGEDMRPVFDRRKIANRYMRTPYFVADFIAIWPWSLVKQELVVLELLRCVNAPSMLVRVLVSFHILDQPKALASWGFVRLLLFLTVYLHWVACLWYSVSKDGWFKTAIADYPVLDGVHPYWVSLKAALHLTVGASGLDTVLPTSDTEARLECGE
jgi:hypothetical protein